MQMANRTDLALDRLCPHNVSNAVASLDMCAADMSNRQRCHHTKR